MRTGRSLTVCWSLLPGEGSLLPGDVWSGGVCLVRGCVSGRGGLCFQGVSGPGGWVGGYLVWGGVYPSMYWGRHPSPPVDRQTPVKILPWPNFVAAGKNVLTDNHYEAIYGPVRVSAFPAECPQNRLIPLYFCNELNRYSNFLTMNSHHNKR